MLAAAAALSIHGELPPWIVMWALSVAIFAICKRLALAAAKPGGGLRRVAFLFAWPGMNADAFLHGAAAMPRLREWLVAGGKIALGAVLYFVLASRASDPRFRTVS